MIRLPSMIVARACAKTRALLLLALLVLGSIVGKDAVLVHQIALSREYARATAFDEPEARALSKAPPSSKARPSGLSKRSAWSPTDPPDDDDETDDDSDTVAVRVMSIAAIPQPIVLAPVVLGMAPVTSAPRASPTCIDLLCAPPRGPPLVA